jgi:hypothetical protein
MTKFVKKTPVRGSLRKDSRLMPLVFDNLGALDNLHLQHFDKTIRRTISDSLDLDKAMNAEHPESNRWDYLLGHHPSRTVVAVELHQAKDNQITNVINKRRKALEQMEGHLRDGVQVKKWLWVASGKVYLANTEKDIRRLDQNDIEFVGKRITAKNLPK